MKVTKLLHTRYRVNDLEKTAFFYKEVLGLEELSRKISPRGSTLIFFKAPESQELIEICHYPSSGVASCQADLTHLAFEVPNIAEFAKHSASLGYPLSDGPMVTSSGSKIAFIDAPEGYEIELIEHH